MCSDKTGGAKASPAASASATAAVATAAAVAAPAASPAAAGESKGEVSNGAADTKVVKAWEHNNINEKPVTGANPQVIVCSFATQSCNVRR